MFYWTKVEVKRRKSPYPTFGLYDLCPIDALG